MIKDTTATVITELENLARRLADRRIESLAAQTDRNVLGDDELTWQNAEALVRARILELQGGQPVARPAGQELRRQLADAAQTAYSDGPLVGRWLRIADAVLEVVRADGSGAPDA